MAEARGGMEDIQWILPLCLFKGRVLSYSRPICTMGLWHLSALPRGGKRSPHYLPQ